MCCVGTKLAIRDCDYVVRRFVQSGRSAKSGRRPTAPSGSTAPSTFRAGKFRVELRVGKIVRTKDGLYYLKSV
jgi:hypothetical protein